MFELFIIKNLEYRIADFLPSQSLITADHESCTACLLIHVYPEETTFEKVFIHLKEPNEKFTMQRQQHPSKKIKILPS